MTHVLAKLLLALALAPAAAPAAPATPPPDDVVLRAMVDELGRTRSLALPDAPSPYYASYTVIDFEQVVAEASLGASVKTQSSKSRVVAPIVRVGSYELDAVGVPMTFEPPFIAFENDYDAVRRELWLLSDSAYKNAALGHRHRETQRAQRTEDPEEADAFTPHQGTVEIEAGEAPSIERERLEQLAKAVSAELGSFPHIQRGEVTVTATASTRRFASTEGDLGMARSQTVTVHIVARTQAEDGEVLAHGTTLYGTLADFVTDDAARAAARTLASELEALRIAPVLEHYTGPVLVEGEAAGEWIAQGFAPQLVAGMRWGGDFENKLGQPVLPRGVSIVDDPLRTTFGDAKLLGSYRIDAEGVAAEKVELVKDGKLTGLLSGRTPTKKITRSNGHGRGAMPGMPPQPSFGNLLVESSKGLGDAALQKKLLERAKKAGSAFGLVIRRSEGPHRPTVAEKVHPDGRRELVRVGFVERIEPRSFRDVVAVGKTATVTHQQLMGFGVVGGGMPAEYAAFVVPASIAAPALLFEELELHRRKGGNPKPPSYPRPNVAKR